MRMFGIISLLLACGLLAWCWFALAWDGGTARATTDKIGIAFAAVLILASAAMIVEMSWAWKLSLGLWSVLLAALIGGQLLSIRQSGPSQPALALHQLPEWSPRPDFKFSVPPRQWAEQRKSDPQWRQAVRDFEQRIAGALSATWWQTSIEDLRRLRQDNDAVARDWELQGDDHVRLIVLYDPYLEILDGKYFPLNVFILANTASGSHATMIADGFYSEDRNRPVDLKLTESNGPRRAAVELRGSDRCHSLAFAIDAAKGTLTPQPGLQDNCR